MTGPAGAVGVRRPSRVLDRLRDPETGWLHPPLLFTGLFAVLFLAVVFGAGVGAFSIGPLEVVSSILHRIGLDVGRRPDALGEDVLWQIRFPRVVLALLVGACLGCAGASMQGVFSNPLADPGIVGVSSGAVMGAAAQIVLGFSFAGTWSITIAAFVGGLVTVIGVYFASRSNGRTEVVTLVLTGIAVNALVGAIIIAFFLGMIADRFFDGQELPDKILLPFQLKKEEAEMLCYEFKKRNTNVKFLYPDSKKRKVLLQLAEQNVHIQFDSDAREWLGKRGYDKLYGARPMARPTC